MSENGKIYISKYNEFGKFHHSSFLSGEKVAAAGEISINKGIIKVVNNRSGHYMPNIGNVKNNVLDELDSRFYFGVGNNTKESIQFLSEF